MSPVILMTLHGPGVIDIEPCAIIDPELDAWVEGHDPSAGSGTPNALSSWGRGRPAPE